MSPSAIVQQIDHLLITCRDPQALFTLFTETFGLPVTWDFKVYNEFGGVTSGGVFFGNTDIDFLKFDDSNTTRLHGIAFEPTKLETAISLLALHNIPARASVPFEGTMPDGKYGIMWRNLIMPWFLGDAMIFLCDREPYAHERRAKLQSKFDGGKLGIKGVRQIVAGTTDFARMRSMPACSIRSSIPCIGSIPRIGGVPLMNRRMPSAGVNRPPMANTSAAPIHPWIG